MPSKHKVIVRIISLFLVAAFGPQEVVWAAPDAFRATPRIAAPAISLAEVLKNPSLLEVPSDAFILQETHPGTNGRFIVHIQDAHANLSGQESLARGLSQMVRRYGWGTVLVEGAEGDVTLDPIKPLAGPEDWRRVGRKFLMQGKIAGEEYLNLTTDLPIRLIGIEDQSLYEEALLAYARLAAKRKPLLAYLHRVRTSLDRVKNRIYPKAVLAFEEKFIGDGEGWEKKAGRLLDWADEAGLDRTDLQVLTLYDELRSQESALHFDAASADLSALEKDLQRVQADGAKSSQKTRMPQTSAAMRSRVEVTVEKARRAGISLAGYPHFAAYARYIRRTADLDPQAFFKEAEVLEDRIYQALLKDESARVVRAIDRHLELLEKAYRIQLSAAEHHRLTSEESGIEILPMLAYLNRRLIDLGYMEDLVPTNGLLMRIKKAREEFYTTVEARDRMFVKNVGRFLDGSSAQGSIQSSAAQNPAAFLIAGGYHTQNLTRLLREAGYGYAVLTPVVRDTTDHAAYENVLLAELKNRRPTQLASASQRATGDSGADSDTIQPVSSTLRSAAVLRSGTRLSELVDGARLASGVSREAALAKIQPRLAEFLRTGDVAVVRPAGARLANGFTEELELKGKKTETEKSGIGKVAFYQRKSAEAILYQMPADRSREEILIEFIAQCKQIKDSIDDEDRASLLMFEEIRGTVMKKLESDKDQVINPAALLIAEINDVRSRYLDSEGDNERINKLLDKARTQLLVMAYLVNSDDITVRIAEGKKQIDRAEAALEKISDKIKRLKAAAKKREEHLELSKKVLRKEIADLMREVANLKRRHIGLNMTLEERDSEIQKKNSLIKQKNEQLAAYPPDNKRESEFLAHVSEIPEVIRKRFLEGPFTVPLATDTAEDASHALGDLSDLLADSSDIAKDPVGKKGSAKAAALMRMVDNNRSFASLIYEDILVNNLFKLRRKASKDPAIKSRYDDFIDEYKKIIAELLAVSEEDHSDNFNIRIGDHDEGVILVVRDGMSPSIFRDLWNKIGDKISGIVTTSATEASHWIIVLQNLPNPPPVVYLDGEQEVEIRGTKYNVNQLIDELDLAEEVLIRTGKEGSSLFINPSEDRREELELARYEEKLTHDLFNKALDQPVELRLLANMIAGQDEKPADGAGGVGMYRTEVMNRVLEFLFRGMIPGVAENNPLRYDEFRTELIDQYRAELNRAEFEGKVVTFRTFDIQQDKNEDFLYDLMAYAKKNPNFLQSVSDPDRIIEDPSGFNFYRTQVGRRILIEQILALFLAHEKLVKKSNQKPILKIMIPQIRTVEDLNYFQNVLGEAKKVFEEIGGKGKIFDRIRKRVKFGAMIETVDSIENIDAILSHELVQFVSVGTNDLTEEIMSREKSKREPDLVISRDIAQYGHYFTELRSEVLDELKKVAEAIVRSGKDIEMGFCGEIAGSGKFLLFILYLQRKYGVNAYASMSSNRLAMAAFVLRHMDGVALNDLFDQIEYKTVDFIANQRVWEAIYNSPEYIREVAEPVRIRREEMLKKRQQTAPAIQADVKITPASTSTPQVAPATAADVAAETEKQPAPSLDDPGDFIVTNDENFGFHSATTNRAFEIAAALRSIGLEMTLRRNSDGNEITFKENTQLMDVYDVLTGPRQTMRISLTGDQPEPIRAGIVQILKEYFGSDEVDYPKVAAAVIEKFKALAAGSDGARLVKSASAVEIKRAMSQLDRPIDSAKTRMDHPQNGIYRPAYQSIQFLADAAKGELDEKNVPESLKYLRRIVELSPENSPLSDIKKAAQKILDRYDGARLTGFEALSLKLGDPKVGEWAAWMAALKQVPQGARITVASDDRRSYLNYMRQGADNGSTKMRVKAMAGGRFSTLEAKDDPNAPANNRWADKLVRMLVQYFKPRSDIREQVAIRLDARGIWPTAKSLEDPEFRARVLPQAVIVLGGYLRTIVDTQAALLKSDNQIRVQVALPASAFEALKESEDYADLITEIKAMNREARQWLKDPRVRKLDVAPDNAKKRDIEAAKKAGKKIFAYQAFDADQWDQIAHGEAPTLNLAALLSPLSDAARILFKSPDARLTRTDGLVLFLNDGRESSEESVDANQLTDFMNGEWGLVRSVAMRFLRPVPIGVFLDFVSKVRGAVNAAA